MSLHPEFYSNFEIINPEKLREHLLLPKGDAQDDENVNSSPARNICNFLESKHNLQTIIMEKEYVDLDFLDEYRGFYSRAFKKHKKYCSRFHFFSCNISTDDFPRLTDFEKDYLGYVVKRPLDAFVIGRTVLKPSTPDSNKYFVLCQDDFGPNLAGHELEVAGVAFLQQDSQVGLCATVSLWMATKALSKKLEVRSYSPSEITRMATKHVIPFGRPIPSEGLAVEQMCFALQEMGYEPKVHQPKTSKEAKEIIYRYVESEFPLILALGMPGNNEGHAVTVIGHTYNTITSPETEALPGGGSSPTGRYSISSQWVDKFIIHDDRIGPYIELEIVENLVNRSEYTCPVGIINNNRPELWNLDLIIVPLPSGVHLTADRIKGKATLFLSSINATFAHLKLHSNPLVARIAEILLLTLKDDFVLRCYLRKSNQFKERLPEKMAPILKSYYRGKNLPKYVWVVEISEKKWLNEEKKENRLMKGEILIDPTASPYESGIISAHLPNLLFYYEYKRDEDEQELKNPKIMVLSEDSAYPHLARPLSKAN